MAHGLLSLLVAAGVATSAFIAAPAVARPSSSTSGIFADDLKPTVQIDPDRVPVELGVAFSPQTSGQVTALQYYQGEGLKEVTTASLWSRSGDLLARATFAPSSTVGWRTVDLGAPVQLTAGTTYTVSYHAPRGGYAVTENDLTAERTQNGFRLPPNAGVYRYGASAAPTHSYQGSNYLVDVVFSPTKSASTPPPTPSATPTTPKPTATSSPTATPRPTTTPAPTATTSPTPRPSATPSPTATPTTPTAPSTSDPGWTVNAAAVGLAPLGLSCAALPTYAGPAKPARGTTISQVRIDMPLDLSAGDIVVERSCIQPRDVGQGMPVLTTTDNNRYIPVPGKVVIRDSEIDGSLLTPKLAALSTGFIGIADLQRNYVHHLGSGLALMNTGTTFDAVVERNYVTDLLGWGDPATDGNHSDAFTIRDFTDAANPNRTAVIRNNRFDCDSPNATGAFFIQAWAGRIANVRVEGNLLEGDGYQLALEQNKNGYSNVVAIGNRFSGTGFGPSYVTGGPGWSTWQDNYLYSASATLAKGAAVSRP